MNVLKGTCKVRYEIEAKRKEMKRNKTKRRNQNEMKLNVCVCVCVQGFFFTSYKIHIVQALPMF